MKTVLLTALCLIGTGASMAQNSENKNKEEQRIRIKKIEKINGIEKITDTTIVVNGPADASLFEKAGVANISMSPNEQIIINNGATELRVAGSGSGDTKKDGMRYVYITKDGKNPETTMSFDKDIDEEIKKAMKDAEAMCGGKGYESTVTVFTTDDGGKAGSANKQIIVVKKQKLVDLSEEDKKVLGKQNGLGDQQLNLEKMSFYPNPGSGKFKLSFNLAEKGDTEVNVMNLEGRNVYHEKLQNFSGSYEKEIDISTQPKGVYFVKVSQGAHSLVKKLVTE